VLTGTGSFEELPPSLDEMRARFERLRGLDMPYLVAMLGEEVAGFAYAGPFRPRSATASRSRIRIYVAPARGGRGIGRTLLAEVIAGCEGRGLPADGRRDRRQCQHGSIRLHRAARLPDTGTYQGVGYKFAAGSTSS